ncbi:MAG: hypothetical protein A2Y76_08570 [Planctomycetes bacterium RBG_13_60_9]|nr:MAG: hypothetical protein A2Y76_08570 [Planctomycetes bacterium RBG_13_60_9]
MGGILVLIILIVLLIPVVLSSRGFTRWIQATINRSTGGQTDIGDLSVGWLKGIRVADFSFRGENGWAEVDIGRITSRPSYSSLLGGTLALGRTVVDQPRVAIDLRERPPSSDKGPSMDPSQLEWLNEVVVRNGSVRLTDATGRTAQIASLNSDVSLRPAGQTSRFSANAVVAAAQGPGRVQIVGEVTPDKKTGWSLKGTTGDVTVDVNDLDLNSVAPFLAMAGIQVQARGQVSGNIVGALQDGQIENVKATISGRDLDVAGQALKGDRLQTSQLNVNANLTQTNNAISVDQLNVRTDWATISAAGTIPKTVESLSQLLENGAAYDLQGKFDIDLAAVLSQMPNTIGVRQGMEITGGRATGNINTTTEGGRATVVAKAQVAGLAGTFNKEKVSLSGPVLTTLRLSTGKEGPLLEALDVSAPFAKLGASGNFKQIKYQGQADLASLQSELGPFINLGPYELAGQMTEQGQVSLGDKITDVSGSLSAQKLVLASSDGNSVSEPKADVNFAVGIDKQQQVLAVDTLTANASFGTIAVKGATIPLGQDSPAPLNLVVSAQDVDLSKLEPYATMFAALPKGLTLGGIAQSQVTVTKEEGSYHLASTATRIQNFQLTSPEKETFQQPQVTALFDVYIDPNQKSINIDRLQVESPQIKIQKGQFRRTSQGNTAKLQGTLEGQLDWAAVGQMASAFVPGQLTLAGQKQVALNFTSTYPVNEPNRLLAHLNSQASFEVDRAQYMGFDFGPTKMDIRVEDGLMKIGPVSTKVNNGQVNFTGEANLAQTPALLKTPSSEHLAQGIQINAETADKLLKYVNPIFADVVGVSGIANFDLQELAIPLGSAAKSGTQLSGTLWIDQLKVGTSGILNQILGVTGKSVRNEVLTIHRTNLVLQKGVVRYDDMQIDVGDNPINFRGAIGLNGVLDMTIVLPYTIDGRTVRVGQEAQAGQRITLPLTGTISKPELNLQKLVESQLQERILKGLGDILKKR